MADKAKPVVVLRALQLANEQRSAYGMRYNDFARYRKHCANRTHRIRSSLKITHGKGREFKKLPPLLPEIVKDGHLQLLLFEAERAWAYAQELTTASLQPANQDNASGLRHSATGRFRRAVNWSTQLLSICQTLHSQSRLSAENLLEVTIYTIILNGRFLRYRDEFEDALIQLSVAKSLLDDLSTAYSTSRDQALAVLFSDEISPEIRYCAHELGRAKAYDIVGIVAELAPKYRNQIVENCDTLVGKLQANKPSQYDELKTLKERVWEGQPVPVRYPELVDKFLKVQLAEISIDDPKVNSSPYKPTKARIDHYDVLLSRLSDAEDVARKLKETQQPAGTSSASHIRDIHFVHAYILYLLLSRRIQRDLLLMDALLASEGHDKTKSLGAKKPTSSQLRVDPNDSRIYPAVVKLLDTVLQSLAQMRTLSIVDENPDLSSAIDAKLAYANGYRCLYLARCYSQVKKFAEALSLLQHATIHLREAVSSLSLSETDLSNDASASFFPLKSNDIQSIESKIAQDSLQYKRDWFAHNGGSVNTDPSTFKKPLFFNIALNYVELDMDRLQQRAGNQSAAVISTSKASGPIVKAEPATEKKQIPKAKAEEEVEVTRESTQPSRGIRTLLGGWWS